MNIHYFNYPLILDRFSQYKPDLKSVLANSIWNVAPPISDDERRKLLGSCHTKHVLYGGALMHKIPWQTGLTYDSIYQRYVSYAVKKYKQPTVIFDGYDGGPAPKDGPQSRRGGPPAALRNVLFTPSMQLQPKKEDFLSNKKNKQHFIYMFSGYLERSGCQVHHAYGDVDVLIVSTALKVAETCITNRCWGRHRLANISMPSHNKRSQENILPSPDKIRITAQILVHG